MTGVHFLGCKGCGTYDRHNQVTQVALAYLRLRHELKLAGSTCSVDSNYVGTSADGKSKHTDGKVWGSLSWLRRLAICEHSEPNCSQPLGCQCRCMC